MLDRTVFGRESPFVTNNVSIGHRRHHRMGINARHPSCRNRAVRVRRPIHRPDDLSEGLRLHRSEGHRVINWLGWERDCPDSQTAAAWHVFGWGGELNEPGQIAGPGPRPDKADRTNAQRLPNRPQRPDPQELLSKCTISVKSPVHAVLERQHFRLGARFDEVSVLHYEDPVRACQRRKRCAMANTVRPETSRSMASAFCARLRLKRTWRTK